MTIRPERPDEFPAIHTLIEDAFRTAPVSDGDEPLFAERRRAEPVYLPDLALVAAEEERIFGHVMFTRHNLDDGTQVLLLAPLAVRPDMQNRGIGAALVREGLRRGAEAGFGSVVLLGDPAYYGRFGFRPCCDYGIRNADGIPDAYVQALELRQGALHGKHTTITFNGL